MAGKFKAFTVETLRYYKDNPTAYRDKCHAIQEAARKFDWKYTIDEWVELIEAHWSQGSESIRQQHLFRRADKDRGSGMPDSPVLSKSNLGKWNDYYRDLSVDPKAAPRYGDEVTYLMAAAFLADIDTVEDWGCGRGGFRRFCVSPNYIGIDSSETPFADKIVDLCTYRSTAPAILIRHVLEHNYNWE